MKSNLKSRILPVLAVIGVASGATFGFGVRPAHAGGGGGGAPTEVANAISTSTATVEALAPLSLAALGVGLIPMGSMLALKFINMVMSRV